MPGIDIRALQRWRQDTLLEDKRRDLINEPANKLTQVERQNIITIVNSLEYRDQAPSQIVPQFADQGKCFCSGATM